MGYPIYVAMPIATRTENCTRMGYPIRVRVANYTHGNLTHIRENHTQVSYCSLFTYSPVSIAPAYIEVHVAIATHILIIIIITLTVQEPMHVIIMHRCNYNLLTHSVYVEEL